MTVDMHQHYSTLSDGAGGHTITHSFKWWYQFTAAVQEKKQQLKSTSSKSIFSAGFLNRSLKHVFCIQTT